MLREKLGGFGRVRLQGIGLVVLVVGLIGGVYLVNQQRGAFDVREKAAEIKGSQLYLKGPSQVKVGEKFNVWLVLDTTADSQYTISGVDAVVEYISNISVEGVTPGTIFDSYPNLPQVYTSPVTISGVKNYSVNDQGYFNGFTGQEVFATFSFVANRPGTAEIKFNYLKDLATNDTNINGFLANQPASSQNTVERLLTPPPPLTIEVIGVQASPTPTSSPSPLPSPTPTPTPTPTPKPAVRLRFNLAMPERNNQRIGVKIYGLRGLGQPSVRGVTAYAAGFEDLLGAPRPTSVPPPPPSQVSPPPSSSIEDLVLLGETVTNASGAGEIVISKQYFDIPWRIFGQTPSHLIRAAKTSDPKLGTVTLKPGYQQFVIIDAPVPGDLFIKTGEPRQDGLINTFDAADLFRQWGPYAQIQIVPPPPSSPADLNADGTVNNRDLAILLGNFGKIGDYPTPTSSRGTETKEGCVAVGGIWQKWGLAQNEFCQIPAKDAGKACNDGSQCSYGLCKLVERKGPISDVSIEGKTVTVSFNRPQTTALDWIALYRRDAPYASYLQWKYLTNTQAGGVVPTGQVTFPNVANGDYDVRFFLNNGSEEVDRVNVTLPSPSGSTLAACGTYPHEFDCYSQVTKGKAGAMVCAD